MYSSCVAAQTQDSFHDEAFEKKNLSYEAVNIPNLIYNIPVHSFIPSYFKLAKIY